jgi:hypothetical protein
MKKLGGSVVILVVLSCVENSFGGFLVVCFLERAGDQFMHLLFLCCHLGVDDPIFIAILKVFTAWLMTSCAYLAKVFSKCYLC